jgi:hypothetical protein
MACPHCGSWAVKADRSLAGRMVCARCGRPLGRTAERVARSSSTGCFWSVGRAGRWWALALLLAISASLAWLAEGRQPLLPPSSQPGSGLRGSW